MRGIDTDAMSPTNPGGHRSPDRSALHLGAQRAGEPELVKPRHPFATGRLPGWDDDATRALRSDGDEVSASVSDMEPDQKGIPVLVRQYLKLGAKFHAFNIDRAFSDAPEGPDRG